MIYTATQMIQEVSAAHDEKSRYANDFFARRVCVMKFGGT